MLVYLGSWKFGKIEKRVRQVCVRADVCFWISVVTMGVCRIGLLDEREGQRPFGVETKSNHGDRSSVELEWNIIFV